MGNAPSSVPHGGQVSQVQFPIDCTNTVTGEILHQNFTLSATAPLSAGSYYLSNVQAALPYPGSFQGGQLTVSLAFSNAQPSSFQAIDSTFEGTSLVISGQDISDLGPIPKGPTNLGPITVTGDVSRYSVTGVSYIVVDKSNARSTYTCKVPPNIVGSVTNDGVSRPLLPAGDVPSARVGYKATTVNLPLVCQEYPYELQMTGVTPIAPSGTFQVTDYIFFFKVPAAQVQRIKDAAGTEQVEVGILVDQGNSGGSVAGLGFNLTNATPALFDVSNNFTPTDPNRPKYVQATYKTTGGNLTLAFPLDGTITLNPWQTTTSGSIFGARPLGINGLIAGAPIIALQQFNCDVTPAVEIFAGPIP